MANKYIVNKEESLNRKIKIAKKVKKSCNCSRVDNSRDSSRLNNNSRPGRD